MESSHRRTVPLLLIIIYLFVALGGIVFAQASEGETPARRLARTHTDLGIQAKNERRTEDAQKLFRKAIEFDPTYDKPHAEMGEWYSTYMQKDHAIAEYKKAILIKPDHAPYRIRLGSIYLDSSDFKNALEQFKRAKELAPNEPRVYYYLGSTYRKTGDMKTAEENYSALLQLLEKDKSTWKDDRELSRIYWDTKFQLGNIAYENEDFKTAQKHYEDIIEGNTVDEGINSAVKPALQTVKLRNNQLVIQIALGVFVVVLLGMLFFWKFFLMPHRPRAAGSQLPSSAFDAKSYPELSNFAVQHLKIFTAMPRALVYFARREEDPLMLSMADNLERERFEELVVNWEEVPTWIESIQNSPFIFEKQKKEIPFLRSFPRGRDKLEPASPRIGIPFIYEGSLRGIAFMCYPGASKKEKTRLKNLFVKNIHQIRKLAEDVARAADKLYRKEISIADTITPAFNQLYFKERLPEEIHKARETENNLTLMMFECEGMDSIFNRFGEERKNYVLKTLVQALLVKLGTDNAAIFRISDYRFTIIHPDLNVIKAKDIAHQLLELIASLEFTTPIPRISASMGLAVYPEHAEDADILERAAKSALEQALSAGGRSNLVIGTELAAIPNDKVPEMPRAMSSSPHEAQVPHGEDIAMMAAQGLLKPNASAISPVDIRPDASPAEKIKLGQKQPISIAPPPDDEPAVSPSGTLIRPRGGAKSPISIAPPPEAEDKTMERKKGASPFTFRSAPKSPPTAHDPYDVGAPTRTFNTNAAASTQAQTISSFEDLWKGPEDHAKSTGPSIIRKGGSSVAPPKNDQNGNADSQSRVITDRRPRRPLMPKDNPRETSLIRRAPMREVGSATSKLPPLPKANEPIKRPMTSLVRRGGLNEGEDEQGNGSQNGASGQASAQMTDHEAYVNELLAQGVDPDKIVNQRTETLKRNGSDPLAPRKFSFRESMPKTGQNAPAGSGAAHMQGRTPPPPVPPQPRAPVRPPVGTAPLPKIGTAPLKAITPHAAPQSVRPGVNPPPGALANPAAKQAEPKKPVPPGMEDQATGFFQKAYFEQSIGRLMVRANQTKRPLCILFFKLDRHKELKQKYGEDKLNHALKEIATMIKSFLKEGSDVPARYSEEIFVIILPDTSFQLAFNLAEQIRFTAGNFSFRNIPGQITLSLGIASFPDKGKSPKELMKNSYDSLVYAIKAGGNRSVIWDPKYFKTP